MIRLKAKQQEKKAEDEKAAAAADDATTTETTTTTAAATEEAEKPKTVKILGVGRGKRAGASKEKKRTPGEIRIQKGAHPSMECGMRGGEAHVMRDAQTSRNWTAGRRPPSRSRR